jgi:hypothetical protein
MNDLFDICCTNLSLLMMRVIKFVIFYTHYDCFKTDSIDDSCHVTRFLRAMHNI